MFLGHKPYPSLFFSQKFGIHASDRETYLFLMKDRVFEYRKESVKRIEQLTFASQVCIFSEIESLDVVLDAEEHDVASFAHTSPVPRIT